MNRGLPQLRAVRPLEQPLWSDLRERRSECVRERERERVGVGVSVTERQRERERVREALSWDLGLWNAPRSIPEAQVQNLDLRSCTKI